MKRKRKNKIQQMTMIAVNAAVLCILGPISLPIGVVPLSLTMLVIYFGIYALGMWKGTISYLVYLGIGLVGLPVFSGFQGGPARLFGPTGGYLIGFIFLALISGFFIDKSDKWYVSLPGMLTGTIVCYGFGTAWLAYQLHLSFAEALAIGVLPFLPGDALKIVAALMAGPMLRRRLKKATLIS